MIASGFWAKAISIPCAPSSASRTFHSCRAKSWPMRLRPSASSSMSKTVGMGVKGRILPRDFYETKDFQGVVRPLGRGVAEATERRGYSACQLKEAGAERAGFSPFPAQVGMKIDLLGRHVEADRAKQIRNALAAFHRFFQAARKKLDVFLVGFEREFA